MPGNKGVILRRLAKRNKLVLIVTLIGSHRVSLQPHLPRAVKARPDSPAWNLFEPERLFLTVFAIKPVKYSDTISDPRKSFAVLNSVKPP